MAALNGKSPGRSFEHKYFNLVQMGDKTESFTFGKGTFTIDQPPWHGMNPLHSKWPPIQFIPKNLLE